MDTESFPAIPSGESDLAVFLNNLARSLPELSESDIERSMGILPGILGGTVPTGLVARALDSIDDENLPVQKRLLIGELGIDFRIIDEDWDGCLPVLAVLLDIAENEGLLEELAILFNYRGVCYYRLARYPEARTDLEESLRLADEIGSDRRRARASLNLGLVLQEMGLWEDAASHYREALRLSRDAGDDRTLLSCYLNIGYIYIELKRYDDGRKALLKGIDLAVKLDESVERIRGTLNLAVLVLDEAVDLNEAVSLFEKVIEEAGAIEADQLAARARSNLAYALLQLGRYEESLAQSTAGLNQAGTESDTETIWRTEANMGRALWKLGRNDEADRHFRQAFTDFDILRKEQVSDRERAEIQIKLRNLTGDYIAFSLETMGPETAFSRLARSKSRALADITSDSRRMKTGQPVSDAEFFDLLQEAIRSRGGTVVLDYFIHKNEISVFVSDGYSVNYTELGVTEDTIQAAVTSFEKEINLFTASREYRDAREGQACEPPDECLKLYDLLIGPIENKLREAESLIIIPQGILHRVPYQALSGNNKRYLCEKFAISFINSGDILLNYGPRDIVGQNKIAVLKGCVTGLDAVNREITQIEEIFGQAVSFVDISGVTQSVEKLGDAGIIHFAGHAEFDESDPYSSALILEDGTRMEVAAIMDQNLDLAQVNLVTLAGCETGRGRVGTGDEVISIARAFIGAGVRNVLVSRWKISDSASLELIAGFYRGLVSGLSFDKALQGSNISMLSKGRIHPYFFAPFIIIGSG